MNRRCANRPDRRGSAAERVVDRRADLAHGVAVDLPDGTGERSLGHRVETVAVDHRWSVQADSDVIEIDLGDETADHGGDLGHCDKAASVEHFGSGE